MNKKVANDPNETKRRELAERLMAELKELVKKPDATPDEINELRFRAEAAGVPEGEISDAIFFARREAQGFSDMKPDKTG